MVLEFKKKTSLNKGVIHKKNNMEGPNSKNKKIQVDGSTQDRISENSVTL